MAMAIRQADSLFIIRYSGFLTMAHRRAAITGSGALTPIGNDAAAIWQSLRDGKSGIAPIRAFDVTAFPSRIGGEVKDFAAKKHFDNKDPNEKTVGKSLRMMARTIQLGLVASKLAMADANLKRGDYDPTRFGVVFGSSMIAIDVDDIVAPSKAASDGSERPVDLLAWGDKLETVEPTWMLKYLPNMAACHVSILHDLQGPSNSLTEDDVASMLALGEAYRHIDRGQADAFLVGGSDSKFSYLSFSRHSLFLPLSRRNEAPEKACRPFDRDRDGMVMAEGGAVLVVEELEHAKKRGANIRAEIVGYGAAFDAKRDGSGLARAIAAAFRQAGIGPEDLDHVNAHAYGVRESDAWEAQGLRSALGRHADRVPVFAGKSYTGNLGPAGGVTELIFALHALDHGALPATLNHQTPDPACPVLVHADGLRPVSKPYLLKVGYTDMGQCAAVVLRKWS
jgi:3-oxoacyl-[acyl-carrier-protein] synthase II